MTRTEYIKKVAEQAGMSQKAVKEVLGVMQEVAYSEMKKGDVVKIFDSVSLIGNDVPERTARNPQTGGTVVVPAHIAPKAKFGKGIKDFLKA